MDFGNVPQSDFIEISGHQIPSCLHNYGEIVLSLIEYPLFAGIKENVVHPRSGLVH